MRLYLFSRQGAAWLLVLSVLLLFSCSGSGDGGDSQVLWFSDIHFDPFADPDIVADLTEADHADWGRIFTQSAIHGVYPSTGRETNYRLLRESLRDMRKHVPGPDLILFTGDFLAHYFNENYAALTGDAGQAGQIFSRAYGPGELSPQRMDQLWADVRNNPGIRNHYATAYAAFRTPVEISDQNSPYYWNAIGILDGASYRRAFQEHRSAPVAATSLMHGTGQPSPWIAGSWSALGPFQGVCGLVRGRDAGFL
ncbi:metallophosphoesterase family protein [Desulfonatronum thiodismutans]|uniref:hypothetical protein n=1 Tax=Desulfonatronum thiodismutans TaxID=159290 RepID=UPI0004ABD88B|nr:hypothetical protein [Desulfonatronum thiodismutans]